jgi:hypothetical protein
MDSGAGQAASDASLLLQSERLELDVVSVEQVSRGEVQGSADRVHRASGTGDEANASGKHGLVSGEILRSGLEAVREEERGRKRDEKGKKDKKDTKSRGKEVLAIAGEPVRACVVGAQEPGVSHQSTSLLSPNSQERGAAALSHPLPESSSLSSTRRADGA